MTISHKSLKEMVREANQINRKAEVKTRRIRPDIQAKLDELRASCKARLLARPCPVTGNNPTTQQNPHLTWTWSYRKLR
jgi:hypothetical protein